MGRYLKDIKTGHRLDINHGTYDYLAQITTGLFELFGIEFPLCVGDCKIVARILRNNLKYQAYGKSGLDYYRIIILDPEDDINFLNQIVEFFENAEKGIEEIR